MVYTTRLVETFMLTTHLLSYQTLIDVTPLPFPLLPSLRHTTAQLALIYSDLILYPPATLSSLSILSQISSNLV